MNVRARTVREETEAIEAAVLAPWATRSSSSRGRARPEEPDELRTAFQRDRDRILHTKAFRRLKHKTQVFVAPEGDHYRTRLTHTLEVAQVARTICRALRLNEDLVEAICLGHDLGHTPFGHVGEEVLGAAMGRPFEHNRQSLRVVDRLERDGAGLNLTWEVRDGILNHTWRMPPAETPEGMVARWSDRIAYVNHDVDDAIRAGLLGPRDLPEGVVAVIGDSYGERVGTLVASLVEASREAAEIRMPEDVAEAMGELRSFLFERVYLGPAREQAPKIARVLHALYDHYLDHPDDLGDQDPDADAVQRVSDHISGMTDRYALRTFERLFVPHADP